MRKIAIILLVILISSFYTVVLVSAEGESENANKPDSVTISTEIMEALNITDVEQTVFRIYTVSLNYFRDVGNVHDLLKLYENRRPNIVIENADETFSSYDEKWLLQEKEISFAGEVFFSKQEMFEFKTNTAIKKVSANIQIKSIYFLRTFDTTCEVNAIYYETDKGDYLYWHHWDTGDLIFPIEDFCQLQKAIYEKYADVSQVSGEIINGEMILPSDVWSEEKLALYAFNANTFAFCLDPITEISNPEASAEVSQEVSEALNESTDSNTSDVESTESPKAYLYIAAGVVVASGITTAVLVRRKKKKAE